MDEVAKAEAGAKAGDKTANVGDEAEKSEKHDANGGLEEDVELFVLKEVLSEKVAEDEASNTGRKIGKEDIEAETDEAERKADDGDGDEDDSER